MTTLASSWTPVMDCSSIYFQTVLPMPSDGLKSEGKHCDKKGPRCEIVPVVELRSERFSHSGGPTIRGGCCCGV